MRIVLTINTKGPDRILNVFKCDGPNLFMASMNAKTRHVAGFVYPSSATQPTARWLDDSEILCRVAEILRPLNFKRSALGIQARKAA